MRLSLDLKATHALRDELEAGLEKYQAKAGAGAIIDVNTGEIIALESLPDYDPNDPPDMTKESSKDKINRINVGVYEMGSTFKAISISMALNSGKVNLGSRIDARDSLRYGRFTIHDFHATHRVLTVPEVFTHSSNIGTARMALMVGVQGHQAFLRKMGQLDRLRTELPESAEPLVPKRWTELNTMTIAFGQGRRRADSSVDGSRRIGQRRPYDRSDFPDAKRGGRDGVEPSRGQRANLRVDALSHALQRDAWIGELRQHRRLLCRRQDGNRGQDHPRPLFARQGFYDLHGDNARRQAEISLHGAL